MYINQGPSLIGHNKPISSIKFMPNFSDNEGLSYIRVATGSSDRTIKIWAPFNNNNNNNKDFYNNNIEPLTTFRGHRQGISDISWNPSGQYLASASDDKTIKLWDINTSTPILSLEAHTSYVFTVAFSPTSSLLASGSFDEKIMLWDIRTGSVVKTIPAHADAITSMSWNIEGTTLASGGHDGLVRIWDIAQSACISTFFYDGNPPVGSVVYSPNGRYLLVSTLDNRLRLWNVSEPIPRCMKIYKGHKNSKYSIYSTYFITPHEKLILSGSEDNKIYFWDINSRSIKSTLDHNGPVLALDAHKTQGIVATATQSEEKSAMIWYISESIDNDNNGNDNNNSKKRKLPENNNNEKKNEDNIKKRKK